MTCEHSQATFLRIGRYCGPGLTMLSGVLAAGRILVLSGFLNISVVGHSICYVPSVCEERGHTRLIRKAAADVELLHTIGVGIREDFE